MVPPNPYVLLSVKYTRDCKGLVLKTVKYLRINYVLKWYFRYLFLFFVLFLWPRRSSR